MELKQFSHRELKAINNGNPPVEKLPGYALGNIPDSVGLKNTPTYMRLAGAYTKTPGLTTPPQSLNISQQSVKNMMNETPNIPHQNTDSKQRAKFMNTGGPSTADQNAAAIHPYFALGAWAGGGVLEGISRIKSADEHLADAGTSQARVNGIAYTQQNSVDSGKIMSEYDDTTAKDFLTNPFRGIASLFGRGKAQREADNAARRANVSRIGARDNAYAQYLDLDFAKKYGNQEDQMLYAKNGKLPGFVEGFVSGLPNARVSNGEVIANKSLGIMQRVPGLKNNKDGKLATLTDGDTVITNKHGLSDYAWQTGDIEGAEQMMKAFGKPSYKCGKLPGFAEGWLGNFVPAALGALASLDLTINAYKNKPFRPDTYADNPYQLEGLSTLAGLRVNPYPIIQQLRNAEVRSNRAIDIAGGLSGSQRTAARLANLNTTQKNIANMLSSIQQLNNAYRANYAQAAINAGQQARTARMAANQWDLDYYSKAHAARNKGILTGIANMLAQIQQYQANEFKRRLFNETMDLYRYDLEQRKQQNQWMRNYYASQGNAALTFTPTQAVRGIAPSPITSDLTNPRAFAQSNQPTYTDLANNKDWRKWLYGGY